MKPVIALSVSLVFLILAVCAPAQAQSNEPAGPTALASWSEATMISSGWETWPRFAVFGMTRDLCLPLVAR